MVAISEPHLVFEFAVYAKYREKDGPNQDEVALQVSSNFGNIVTDTCNIKRETLIARIRGRSGYFQGCNPKAQSNNENGDGGVTYTAFEGEEKDYVEIDIGVVNRFDCDKLLPLYYYELESLAVRPITNSSGGSLSSEDEVLSNALKLLQVDDGYYVVKDVPATSGTPTTTIAIAVSVVVGILFVAAVAAVCYVRRERRKLRKERERRRQEKEIKLAAREARRQRKHNRSIKKEARGKKERVEHVTLDDEEYIPVKENGDSGSLDADDLGGGDEQPTQRECVKHAPDDDDSDADSELERLFEKCEPDMHSRDEEDDRPVRQPRRRRKKEDGGSETDSASLERLIDKSERSNTDFHSFDQSNTSLHRRKNRRRRKKTDGESDSDTTDHGASNFSGMNYTATSNTDKTPATRSQSSHFESDQVSVKPDADNESEPPIRIDLSERGTLQKGISDISLGLASSFKKSFTKAAATLEDLQEDGSDLEKEDPKHKKGPSRKDSKEEGTRPRRRRTLTKVMSSFRKSSTEIKGDDGAGTGTRRKSRPAISKVMSSFRKSIGEEDDVKSSGRKGSSSRKRLPMGSLGRSVRNLVIGELSSSSDDDSSSDSESSSDSDSSSSSSDRSADVKRRRNAKKAVESRKTSTGKKSTSRKEKAPRSDTSGQRKYSKSKRGHGHEQASEDSEVMSKTNDYLPHMLEANFDDGSCAAVAMPESPPEKHSRGDDSTCAAVATMKPPSQRSLGSRTKPSRSNSDSHRADSKKVSKRTSKDDRGGSHGNRERKKKSHKKKGEDDRDANDGQTHTLERRSSRKVLENVTSSLKRSLSSSIKGLSLSAKSALESEDARDTKDDSKRRSTNSSKKKSTHKHHNRDDSERGSDRNNHRRHRDDSERVSDRDKRHRLDDSERGSDRNSERNAEKASRRRHSRRKDSDPDHVSDRETNRVSSHKGSSRKSSHRTKTKSSSSKHSSHKKSSGDGERVRRRRDTESAN
jgi:type II secretory pathway pseudopilin PulG